MCIDNPCNNYGKNSKCYRCKVTHTIREVFQKVIIEFGFQIHIRNIIHEETQQPVYNFPDPGLVIQNFENIGSKLSSKLPKIQAKPDFVKLERTLVVHQTIDSDVNLVIRKIKCEKNYGEDSNSMKLSNAALAWINTI